MKRLVKVAMLDPSPEFIGHLGMFGDPGLPIVALIKSNAPDVKDVRKLGLEFLWHLITLRNFSLTLTNVTMGDKVMGILVDGGPIES
ncbi:hypothetical protein Tco_1165201 [Tanacetum coccineum]